MRQPRVLLSRVQGVAAALGFLLAGAAQASDFTVETRKVPDMKAMFGQVQSRDVLRRARASAARSSAARSTRARRSRRATSSRSCRTRSSPCRRSRSTASSARSNRSSANANDALQRAQDLLPRGFVTKAAFDQAKTNVDVLQHQVESMRSQRAVVAQQMNEGSVLAPKDGRVLTLSAIPGAVVMPGEPIARIAAGALFLRLSLPERHAALLQLGAPVLLAPRGQDAGAATGGMRKGRIVKIYPEIDNGRVIADAEVDDLGDHFVGERVKILAPVGEREVILIPRAAVTTRSGIDYVRVSRPEGPLDVAIVFAEFGRAGQG